MFHLRTKFLHFKHPYHYLFYHSGLSFLLLTDMHVIEFQKRGLPHAYILLTLANKDKSTCGEDIDKVICAELSNNVSDLLAFKTVTRHMIYGPCGNGVFMPHAWMVVSAQNINQRPSPTRPLLKIMGLLNIGIEMMVEV